MLKQVHTLTQTIANAELLRAALNTQVERGEIPDETDEELFTRWLETIFTEVVYRHQQQQAKNAVAPDAAILEVT